MQARPTDRRAGVRVARSVTCAAAIALAAGGVLAQEDDAGASGSIALELNNATDVETGCRLTYVATNDTGTELDAMSYEVAVFDGAGVVTRLLILEFGTLPAGKTKVVQFDLTQTTCGDISRVLVNTVAECSAAEGADPDCLSALVTSSRQDIDFGL